MVAETAFETEQTTFVEPELPDSTNIDTKPVNAAGPEFTISQRAFVDALSIVSRSVMRGPSVLPVLKNILLDTRSGRLELHATDMKTWTRVQTGYETNITRGATSVDARALIDLVKGLTGDRVTIQNKESGSRSSRITITAGGTTLHLPKLPVEEFPEPWTAGDGTAVELKAEALATALKLALISVAPNDNRPVLACVHLVKKGSKLAAVTADGFRGTEYTWTDEDTVDSDDFDVLIPAASARILRELLDGSETVDLRFGKDHQTLTATLGNQVQFCTSLVEGNFPEAKDWLKTDGATIATVDRVQLLKAVRRANFFGNRDFSTVAISIGADQLTVRNDATQNGESTDIIGGVDVDGEPVHANLNAPYLIDVLDAIPGEYAQIKIKSKTTTVGIDSVDLSGFRHVIMPIVNKDDLS